MFVFLFCFRLTARPRKDTEKLFDGNDDESDVCIVIENHFMLENMYFSVYMHQSMISGQPMRSDNHIGEIVYKMLNLVDCADTLSPSRGETIDWCITEVS